MKFKIKKLIPNRFYCLETLDDIYYIKYVNHDHNSIWCDGYYLDAMKGVFDGRIKYHTHPTSFWDICYLDSFHKYYEVDITLIIDYLPSNNPDKINYYRRKKINSLLNETQIR